MKYLKEILVLISLVILVVHFIFVGCSPTVQVVCGRGETDGTLSNIETPRVDVRTPVAVQAPGTNQSIQSSETVQDIDTK